MTAGKGCFSTMTGSLVVKLSPIHSSTSLSTQALLKQVLWQKSRQWHLSRPITDRVEGTRFEGGQDSCHEGRRQDRRDNRSRLRVTNYSSGTSTTYSWPNEYIWINWPFVYSWSWGPNRTVDRMCEMSSGFPEKRGNNNKRVVKRRVLNNKHSKTETRLHHMTLTPSLLCVMIFTFSSSNERAMPAQTLMLMREMQLSWYISLVFIFIPCFMSVTHEVN